MHRLSVGLIDAISATAMMTPKGKSKGRMRLATWGSRTRSHTASVVSRFPACIAKGPR